MRNICCVEGCNNFCEGRGFCNKHYRRWKKYGDPNKIAMFNDGFVKQNKKEWYVYRGIINRCCDKKSPSYNLYGGRGIKICDRWLGLNGFKNFMNDMGPRPEGKYSSGIAKYSIDRIDVNGNYCPENCRWATAKQQANNTRTRKTEILFLCNGRIKNFKEMCAIFGIKYQTAYCRYKKGLPINKVFENKLDSHIIKI